MKFESNHKRWNNFPFRKENLKKGLNFPDVETLCRSLPAKDDRKLKSDQHYLTMSTFFIKDTSAGKNRQQVIKLYTVK